jgi:signal transduction histidine kinase/integral membrane sensor domain MASE1
MYSPPAPHPPLRGASGATSWTMRSADAGSRTWIGIAAVVAAAYVVAAKLGFRVAFVAEQVTTVWPPTGLAEAALLLWGRSLWPAIWFGAFITNAGTNVPLWAAASIATGNTIEAVVAAAVLLRLKNFDPALRFVRDALAFIVVAALVATLVSATIGSATLCAAGVQSWSRFGALWRDWWLGDTVGALIVAPALLTIARMSPVRSRRIRIESTALVLGCIATTQVVFGHLFQTSPAHHPLEYVVFPFVIAAAVRTGQPATSLVVLGASAVSIWNTTYNSGPFAGTDPHQGLILLQVFLGVLAGTGLLLAAATAEQKTGEQRRAAVHAVGEVLARAPDLSSAAPAILRAIGLELDWTCAAIWLVDTDDQRLRCLSVWRDAALPLEFETTTMATEFSRGVGLPGRVWADGQPYWVKNVIEDSNFPRWRVAQRVGIRGAFGFPICVGADVLGVVECFNRAVMSPDEDLLRTMTAVGFQIGQFMERKRVESAVAAEQRRTQVARVEAEAANRAKDEFLATLSHELRTPLNAILGWARMLRDGTLDEEKTRKALEVIDRNAALQVRLVEDILDISRIIAGGLKLEIGPVDLGAVITAAVDAVRPAAEAREITIDLQLSSSARQIDGDPQRLEQIVWNLVANSVKFTDPGGHVDVQLIDIGADAVRICVHDTGVGIEPAFLPHVFERFRQADSTVSRAHGGLGIGLAIVRHLVELHGGRIRAESAGKDQGATFTIDLSRRAAGSTRFG